jgi:hypothetical protein
MRSQSTYRQNGNLKAGLSKIQEARGGNAALFRSQTQIIFDPHRIVICPSRLS